VLLEKTYTISSDQHTIYSVFPLGPSLDILFSGPLSTERGKSMLRLVLIVLLVLILLGALPSWPYSASWGYYPSGGAGLLLIIVILLIFLEVI
jgi:hypothetical protein